MKVTVDMDKCQDHGQCAIAAPVAFRMNDEEGSSTRARLPRSTASRSRKRPTSAWCRRFWWATEMSSHIAVVGASLAGLRAAERSARQATPVGSRSTARSRTRPTTGPRCPRSLLGGDSADNAETLHARVAFRRRAGLADVDFRLGTRVEQADPSPGPCTWPMAAARPSTAWWPPPGRGPEGLRLPALARVAMSCARSSTASPCGTTDTRQFPSSSSAVASSDARWRPLRLAGDARSRSSSPPVRR